MHINPPNPHSHLPFAPISLPPPASNRRSSMHRMASTRRESRGGSVGSFPSSPRMPPRSSGFRTKWHTLSSSARGLLCFHPLPEDAEAYENHWQSNNKVTPARSKSAPNMSHPPSRDTATAPWNVVRGRSYHVHTMKVAKDEGRRAISDDKMTKIATTITTTTNNLSPPANEPSSETAATTNAPRTEESGARRPRSETPRYDDHMATTPLHLNGTQSRAEEDAEAHTATGDTIEALIDAILQIGEDTSSPSERDDDDSLASLGTSESLLGTEAAIDDKSMIFGVAGDRAENTKTKKQNRSAGEPAWESEEGTTTDAKRAWEDMKRRVMAIEEFGTALPLDGHGYGGAGGATGGCAGDTERERERTSREFRARRRRSWAEKAIRGHARLGDEGSASRPGRPSSKKRRRHAGCWVRENGVFMRLYSRRM